MALITANAGEVAAFMAPGNAASQLTFTRSNSVTAYSVGVSNISSSTGLGRAIRFDRVGQRGRLHNVSIVTDNSWNAPMMLMLFDREPTNFADQAAVQVTSTDSEKLIGVYNFPLATSIGLDATPVWRFWRPAGGIGEVDRPTHAYSAIGGSIYGLLCTVLAAAYTPPALSGFYIRLNMDRDI